MTIARAPFHIPMVFFHVTTAHWCAVLMPISTVKSTFVIFTVNIIFVTVVLNSLFYTPVNSVPLATALMASHYNS